MTWFIFAIISVFAVAIANIYQRLAMKEPESDPLVAAIFFQFALAIITGIFAFFSSFHWPPISQFALYFLISAVFYAAGIFLIFKAIKEIEASELVILTAFSSVITIVIAIIFLGESFFPKQILGTLLIIASVILTQRKFGMSRKRGIWLALAGQSLCAIAVVSDKYILRSYDPISYSVVMTFLPGVFLLAFNPKTLKKFRQYFKFPHIKNLFLYSLFYGIQVIFYYMALGKGANVSQMAPLFRTNIILTMILAFIFLRERINLPIKILSAIMAIIGVILIK